MIPAQYKPILTTGHYVTIWIFIAGLVLAGLSRGNDIENQQIQTKTRQQEIIKKQDEIRQDIKDARKEQAEIKAILININRSINE